MNGYRHEVQCSSENFSGRRTFYAWKKRRKLDKLNKMAVRLQITGIGHYILFFSYIRRKKNPHTKKVNYEGKEIIDPTTQYQIITLTEKLSLKKLSIIVVALPMNHLVTANNKARNKAKNYNHKIIE